MNCSKCGGMMTISRDETGEINMVACLDCGRDVT